MIEAIVVDDTSNPALVHRKHDFEVSKKQRRVAVGKDLNPFMPSVHANCRSYVTPFENTTRPSHVALASANGSRLTVKGLRETKKQIDSLKGGHFHTFEVAEHSEIQKSTKAYLKKFLPSSNIEDEIINSMSRRLAKDLDEQLLMGMPSTLKIEREPDIFRDSMRIQASMMGMPIIASPHMPKGQAIVMNPSDQHALINDIDTRDSYDDVLKDNNLTLAEIL